ncbi:MAG: transglycosylase domain-containing protein [Bacteroidota bacterium]
MNDLSVLEKESKTEEQVKQRAPILTNFDWKPNWKPNWNPQWKPDWNDNYNLPRKIFFGLIGLVALIVCGFVLMTVGDLPPLNEIENPNSTLSTQLLSDDGMVLDNFYATENRVNVRLNEISPYVVDALIATEDARFYEHSGVDYWSIPALIKRNISGTTSGASTITMQLSRNLFNQVSKDRTVTRKIKEVIVSTILEKKYTKQEIVEAYLNTVNIFGNAYGIEMASQRLFGKRAKELNIEEAAVLVGMLKGQGVYDPIRKPQNVLKRRNIVLNLMVKHGFLDSAMVDVDSLKELPLVVVEQKHEHVQGVAPYFRQKIRDYMKEWCRTHTKSDGTNYDLYADGLKVYTTLDSRMQRHAEAAVQQHLQELQLTFNDAMKRKRPFRYDRKLVKDLMASTDRWKRGYKALEKKGLSEKEIEKELKARFEKPVDMKLFSWSGPIDTTLSPMDSLKYMAKVLETGFVSIDPKTGYVKAWVGGIDFSFFKYDHVSQGKRQVGSTFKPFVYGAAIEAGYEPCRLYLNQPVVFDDTDGKGTRWEPKNSDGQYGGKMTMRTALATSTNLITAQLMKELTPSTVVKFATKMGIGSKLEAVPSLCLGTTDLSVLELTGAYSTFVNQGVFIKPIYITRIEDNKGNILEEFPQNTTRALDPRDAYTMLELLKGVVDEPGGTASRLRYKYNFKGDIGAKTGTTQNHSDGWFMGITPELVSGVWVGCADRRMHFDDIKNGQGANMALPIWAHYMKRLEEDPEIKLSQTRFTRPRGYYKKVDCSDVIASQDEIPNPENRVPQSADDWDSFD